MKKVANFFLVFLFGLTVLSSNLFSGDVNVGTLTFDGTLQSFMGSFGLKPFLTSVVIMATALGVMTALKLAIDAFRNPYKGGGGSRR